MDRDHAPVASRRDERDQVVVMRDVDWSVYQTLLDARKGRSRPRLAYLDGVLELMSTSARHELAKTMLARLLEAYAGVRGLTLNGYGETTYCERAKEAGVEPDECYFLGDVREFPDLAIEVVETHGDIDKLEIYRRLGVKEVWWWEDGAILIHRLVEGSYQEIDRSRGVRGIDLHQIARIVLTFDVNRQTQAIEEYRRSLARRPRHARTRGAPKSRTHTRRRSKRA